MISRKAFSLVEILIALIIISLITAAMAPVITKKLSSSGIVIAGADSKEIVSLMCSSMFGDANCIQCSKDKCLKCSNDYYLTSQHVCASCSAGYFCDGTTSVVPCSDKYGTGCTLCNFTKCLMVGNGYFINNDGMSLSCKTQYDPNCTTCTNEKCTACGSGYIIDTEGTTCRTCANMFGNANCIQCSAENCLKCTSDNYLSTQHVCTPCNAGYFCNGTSSTMPCTNKYGTGCKTCNSSKCLTVESGYFISNAGISVSCSSQYDTNCFACNATNCNTCKTGYNVHTDGKTCKIMCAAGSKDYTVAGEYQFTTPYGCTSIKATLVSGGSGGAGGSVKLTNVNFSATNTSWTVPLILKGRPFKLYAIGGGGGAGGNALQETAGHGGYGGMVNGAVATFTTNSTIAVYVGSGGARGSSDYPGSGGGATYLSTHNNNANLVAGGGGGGGSWFGNGGAGGGAGTSNGGSGGYKCPGDGINAGSGANGKPAMDTTARNAVFGIVTNGNGGTHGNGEFALGTAGSNGYLRITYAGENIGGSGGAGGFVVPKQSISVNSAGETLKIIVGSGGSGGNAAAFKADNDLFTQATNGQVGGQSKIMRGNVPLLQTMISDGVIGSGGKYNGAATSAAYITNGLNTTNISATNFATTGSSAATTVNGTAGGTVTINGTQFCQGGKGGSSSIGGVSSTTFGGCGGGGGSPGYAGGNGVAGYVRLEWGDG